MVKMLHFADAHIDMALHGKRDPESGLPLRVMDFLKALDMIVDTAVNDQVDLVLFAGDAYKDRTPAPTFQREWGKRMKRLSDAHIPTLLLVGNHDVSPALGRANAMQEYETLQIPYLKVINRPCLLGSDQLFDLPMQILALPWVSRSGMMAALEISGLEPNKVYEAIEMRLHELVQTWLLAIDPELPTIMTAHASVQGAVYGGERSVMLGKDLVLPGGLVRDPRLDYVALGHIHKAQNLNENRHPPVIYPGSIERVDFGEVADEKYFVIAEIEKGQTKVNWCPLNGRKFIDRSVVIESADSFQHDVIAVLPSPDEMAEAIVRISISYEREWEDFFDEVFLRNYAASAFEFHIIRRPNYAARLRLSDDQVVSSMPAQDLLKKYWQALNVKEAEAEVLQELATKIINEERIEINLD
jgi:exonuclease SbcD